MVQEQLMPRGVHNERVLAVMAKVPREEFVPPDVKTSSYDEQATSHKSPAKSQKGTLTQ